MFRSILDKKNKSGGFVAVVGFKQLGHVCVTLQQSHTHVCRDKLMNGFAVHHAYENTYSDPDVRW